MRIVSLLLMLMPMLAVGNDFNWPNLGEFNFISGRHAVEQDITDQKAIFVAKTDDGYIGKAIDIKLPQHAIYTDGESGDKFPVVVIQAETANEMDMYGAINLYDGTGLVSVSSDFELIKIGK